ncbi:winged helix-turn-helix domain-containing protein [Roseiterribacter gracilis]|uniref:Transcriptional regulator n=1 Tax=Roseiterribacter gracilis TaxID=2812848 RepID=A0A8S8X7Y7_9PROT|nr:transcriptional regulator [Rhodospirillales bacterium TMPK1]
MPPAVRKVDMIYDTLRELLRDAAFPPAEPLSSRDLADTYSVSRTPIRDAFKQLEAEGLLTYIPEQGYFPRVADDVTLTRAYAERAEIIARARRPGANGRAVRRSSDARSTTFRELSRRAAVIAEDTPARLIETILLDVAAHAGDPKCLADARDNVATLAPMRLAEQILPDHVDDAARIVRLYRAGKYDELLRAFRDYSQKRVVAMPSLSRQILRPKVKPRTRPR